MWHYVRVEDYEDNDNIREWARNMSAPYLMTIHEYITGMYVNVPTSDVRLRDVTDNVRKFYFVDYSSTYDEITSTETLGFVFHDSLTNDDLVHEIVTSFTR